MGKRRSEQPPGGKGKFHTPQTKRSLWEDSGDDGVDATGLAQSRDADGKAQTQGQMTRSSASSTSTGAPRSLDGDGEVAAPAHALQVQVLASPKHSGAEQHGLSCVGKGGCGYSCRTEQETPETGIFVSHWSDAGTVSFKEGRDTGIGGGHTSPEGAAPGAASQPESPQRVNSAPDETEEDQPVATTEQHGSAGEELDAETQPHHRRDNVGDSPATPAPGEGAAGREIALPADTPSVLADVPDRHREEGGDGSKCRGDPDPSQELPRASVVNAEENKSDAASERVAGGEHRETVSGERPPATGTGDAVKDAAESWCSPASPGVSMEVSGVCTLSAELRAEGASAELESTGAAGTAGSQGGNASPLKTLGKANTGQEEAGGEETPSPATSLVLDVAVRAGGNLEEECGAEQPELCGGLEGNSLELPPQQPLPAAHRHDAAEPRHEPRDAGGCGRAEEVTTAWEDATDVVCGLILELSNLNRLAMSARRGLEALRKPKPRRSRWLGPVPPRAGSRWKET